MAHLLITGGAGFIGSHTTLCPSGAGPPVAVLDSFANSDLECLHRVVQLANLPPLQAVDQGIWQTQEVGRGLRVIRGDGRHPSGLDGAMAFKSVEAVLHFIGALPSNLGEV